ncbi:MAG TPA: Gx transporter family protein [Lachnospiraceae bacterium]|nr:Gx transporter family protein [Lachnospiraceae bacterium]
MSIKKMTTLAMFTVIALTIFVIESAIPLPVPIPGIKLGLANIITLIVLLNYGPVEALLVLMCRIFLGTMFTGQAMSLLYSLCGGILCLIAMILVNRLLNGHFVFLTSMFGALIHNIGQLAVAYFITATAGVFAYLPFLILSGVLTGLFTGLCAHYTQKYLIPHMKKQTD